MDIKFSIAAPKRPRNQATKYLKSELPLKVAEEMLKYTLMPKAQARNHWKVEIAALLNQLFFKISDCSEMTTEGRRIRTTHYSVTQVKKEIADMTADATDVLKKYKNEKFIVPENFGEGNLFDYGWELRELMQKNYLVWILSYKNTEICKVYGD